MAVTYTAKLALGQVAKGDLVGAWHTLWNSDNLALENRLTKSFAGNPNGQVEGNWKGQQCWDETNSVMYYCGTVGDAATAVWVTPTVNFYSLAPSGTLMLWGGLDADIPSGWSKVTAADGRVLRFTNTEATIGTVVGADSVTPVMSAAGGHTPAGTVGDTTLTINQIPSHTHTLTLGSTSASGTSGGTVAKTGNGSAYSPTIANAGGGQSHTHTFTGTAVPNHTHTIDPVDNRPSSIHYTLIRKN